MINMQLAKSRGLSDEAIEWIKYLHEKMESYLEDGCLNGYSECLYTTIEQFEYFLQRLWGFPQDPDKHTWKHRYKFKCQWAGRTFQCNTTGEELTIPNSVEEGDFFSFGKAFVDVGRLDYYYRTSNCKEVGVV